MLVCPYKDSRCGCKFTRSNDTAVFGAFSISVSAPQKARSPAAGKLRKTAAIDSSYRVGVDQWAFEARPFEFELFFPPAALAAVVSDGAIVLIVYAVIAAVIGFFPFFNRPLFLGHEA